MDDADADSGEVSGEGGDHAGADDSPTPGDAGGSGPRDGADPRRPPETREGWYVLHDFRTVDWDAWRDAPERERERAIREGAEFLRACEESESEAPTAVYSVVGHKADLLVVHLRPTLEELNALERAFERTALAPYTDRTSSYVSVTEVSSYTTDTVDPEAIEDPGLANYVEMRLRPSIPDADYACFYPMDKRRDPEYNWYDLPFEERAELMADHGAIGREYGGKVTQIISGSIGFDDWEWGVTLFADDPTEIKHILYEMRFDPSSSRYAEFGSFYMGRRIAPGDLRPLLAGEAVPADDVGGGPIEATVPESESEAVAATAAGRTESAGPHGGSAGGHVDTPHADAGSDGDDGAADAGDRPGEGIHGQLDDLGVYAGTPHGEDVYAVVVYSEAEGEELFEELRGLRANFDHYDTHVKTAVYEGAGGGDGDLKAVASVWDTQSGADTAGGFLSGLPGVVRQAGDDGGDTWGTMGMFYTVDPDHVEDFHEKFDAVNDTLEGMDGHIRTDLLANREEDNDMFIASRWDSREDAMEFFRSEAFADTVDWGRDVLADRPRHVFLA